MISKEVISASMLTMDMVLRRKEVQDRQPIKGDSGEWIGGEG
jgi:hypothetical protein